MGMFDFLDQTHQEIQKKLSQLQSIIELVTSDQHGTSLAESLQGL
jgi:hypothetical protein